MAASAQGEDRSSFQPVGPWPPNDFGIVKATEGLGWTDPTFARNWLNLKNAGIPRGAYLFFHPSTSVLGQVDHFLAVVKAAGLHPGDMLWLDQELWAGAAGETLPTHEELGLPADAEHPAETRMHLPLETAPAGALPLGAVALAALEALKVQAPHNPVGIYTMGSMLNALAPCTGFDLWIAHPGSTAPASVAPWKTWRIWQYASSGGHGGGDRNGFQGTKAALNKWIGTYTAVYAVQPQHVKGMGRYTQADIEWEMTARVTSYTAYLADHRGHELEHVVLPSSACRYTFHDLKQATKYKLGVLAHPAAPGVLPHYVDVTTK